MTYIRKTKDEYWLMGNYGNGWDFILAEETLAAAKKQKNAYIKEDDFVKDLKIVKKRIPILHEYYIYKLKTNSKEFCCRIEAKDKRSALQQYKNSLLSSGEYWFEGEMLYSSYGSVWCAYK